MADNTSPLNGGTSPRAETDVGRRQTTLLQPATKKADASVPEDSRQWQRRWGMLLFTLNAGCVLWLWMIGIVYAGGVVRTLERRFGLRSTQTGMMMAAGDIVHMCLVVFVGYFGRRGHKPRIICVMAVFSAVGNLLMAVPHWLYNSHATTSSAALNHRKSSRICQAQTLSSVTHLALRIRCPSHAVTSAAWNHTHILDHSYFLKLLARTQRQY